MINRIFHKPFFHGRSLEIEKKASWIELFYDLIFVAAFIQLGNGLKYKHLSLTNLASFGLGFLLIWLIWTSVTFYNNRYTIDDVSHRLLMFCQMLGVGLIASTSQSAFSSENKTYICAFSFALGISSLMYFRSFLQQKIGKAYAMFWGTILAATSALWLLTLSVAQSIQPYLWTLLLVALISVAFSKKARALNLEFPYDLEHLSERYALLTLIVLGESFVKVLGAVSQNTMSFDVGIQAALVLGVILAIWWIYFDDIAGSELKTHSSLIFPAWLYLHLPLQLCMVMFGVSLKYAVTNLGQGTTSNDPKLMLLFTLGGILLCSSGIDALSHRKESNFDDRWRVSFRAISGLTCILCGLIIFQLSDALILFVVLIVALAQIVFDVMTSPEMNLKHYDRYLNEEFQDAEVKHSTMKKNRDISKVLRKGAPDSFRKDLYFFLMERSWASFFSIIIVAYLFANFIFAIVYLSSRQSIGPGNNGAFLDAYFFSVQTMSTIGYGVLSPQSLFANIVVTIESIVGLLFGAVSTGLIFAKFSRPKAKILFSDQLLIHKVNKQDYLMFRVGNTRGNDIVDADISLSALIEETTAEGQRFRKVYDLPLVRNRTPLFSLSWTIMHPLDASSKVNSLLDEHNEQNTKIMSFIVVLKGHDGSYAQTNHARKTYYMEDIVRRQQFVDVIETLADGRLMIDYSKFHDTEEMFS